ncbi:MAG: DNA alkylation repair protein [Oscillibacter sp.]
MSELEAAIQQRLFAIQDKGYGAFQCKLIPTVDPKTVIGVRTPELRKLAKEFSKQPESQEFMKILPHQYYEENNLHGFLIEQLGDYDATLQALNAFLPYVDNWATCDLMSPKIFKEHLLPLYQQIKIWLHSDHSYTVRFGIEMLMNFYLDEHFPSELLDLVADVKSDEYYVNMVIAWFFATALAKQPGATLPILSTRRLDSWTHNKTIQKAVESDRIPTETKSYLRTLKIKTVKQPTNA